MSVTLSGATDLSAVTSVSKTGLGNLSLNLTGIGSSVPLSFSGGTTLTLLTDGTTSSATVALGAVSFLSTALVPTVAIVTEAGRPGVLLVGKKNQPTFQPVELGISSGKNTQILSGLKSGTRVFIDLPPWAQKRK
jgi:hypothetical protein